MLPTGKDGLLIANLEFPRMTPGHEQGAGLLVDWALTALREGGVAQVVGRVTTMVPGDIQLAEDKWFTIYDWDYKIYYDYEMAWGKLDVGEDKVDEIDLKVDLEEAAEIAAKWYKRPVEWCLNLLREWHEHGIIAHLGVRESGKLVAACMAAPNAIRPSTAAIYNIYAPDEASVRQLLAKTSSWVPIACASRPMVADGK